MRIEMASMATLLGGGVTFDVLDGWPAGNKVVDDADFQLLVGVGLAMLGFIASHK